MTRRAATTATVGLLVALAGGLFACAASSGALPVGAASAHAVGEDDGMLPPDATVFDDEYPGIARLDPALVGALRRAAADAADVGVTFTVNTGWRSASYQAELLTKAISEYGSKAVAARWVATPTTSAHVSGDAVDMSIDASSWLAQHGAAYDLCQIYANETWHFELRSGAAAHGCPRMYADASEDPRMAG